MKNIPGISEKPTSYGPTEAQALRLIADYLPMLVSYVDREQRYQFVNKCYADWFKADPQALIGTQIADALGPAYEKLKARIDKALAGEKVEFDDELDLPVVGRKSVHGTYIPYEESGELKGFFAIVADITDSATELKERADELDLLHRAGHRLSSSLEPKRIYQTLRELIIEAMPCDSILVSSFDPVTELITCSYAWISGEEPDPTGFPAIPLAPEGHGMQSTAIRSGQSRIVDNALDQAKNAKVMYHVDPDGTVRNERNPERPVTKSIILVPMKLEERVLGILQVMNYHERAYQPRDLRLLESLMSQVAVAISNAFLYQKAQTEIAERLKADEALRDSEGSLTLALDAGRMGIWDWNLLTNDLKWTKNLEPIHGMEPGTFDGRFESFVNVIHPDDRGKLYGEIEASIKNLSQFDVDFRVVRSDGEIRWVSGKGQAYPDSDGRPIRMIGVGQDVTSFRRAEEEIRVLNASLEERVKERTAELEAANRELEGFCYSIAHDLRAPMRGISINTGIILMDYAHSLDDEGKEALIRMSDAAKRMTALVDDLLQYARLNKQEVLRRELDLTKMAHGIFERILAHGRCAAANYSIKPKMAAEGDPELIEMVLENLIDNACKYAKPDTTPNIEVGSAREKGKRVFFIKDEGIGFDMQYAAKLFRPFERLHRDADYPGTGIGLANVKRIVERHGGKAWAEGEEGKGATFYFTLG